jgi:hypothetical protein
MDNTPTVCQRITLALLRPHKKLTIRQLIRETGVPGDEILPVVNRLIGSGHLVTRGNKVMRLTLVRAEEFAASGRPR